MTQDQIINSTNNKHIKIFLLSQLGLKNSDIAKLLETNAGHVYNVLKEYKGRPEKAEKALKIRDSYPINGTPMPHPETEDNQLI